METVNIRPSQVAEALQACYSVNRPVIIWGKPGIGKSDLVHQSVDRVNDAREAKGQDRDYGLIDLRAVLLDPVDLRGLPMVTEMGTSHWATPEFMPREGEGTFFIDELNRAPTMVQNAFFQLILDRKLGEYELPEGWRIVAACNGESDGGGINRMPQALANRFIHLYVEVNNEDWHNWAGSHGIDPMVNAFIKFKPLLLHEFSKDDQAFPTPRSWKFVSDIINKVPQNLELALVSGAVGQGAAVEFMSFVKLYRNLPDIDRIIEDPDNADVSRDSATMYAICSALSNKADTKNFKNIVRYLGRCPAEYAVFAMRDAVLRDTSLQGTPEFTKWAIENAKILG